MAAQSGALKIPLTAATTNAVGGVIKLENTEGVDLIITRAILDITTEATGTPTLSMGIDDEGDVSSNTLFDAVAIGTAAGVLDNLLTPSHGGSEPGVANKPSVRWPAGHFLVATASASAAGLEGNAFIQFIRAE